ncbi:hypothetical protein P5673_015098 [Acropora cervicornis]|uniref:Uncharacterized protein n=1 Tax=Acropora cervicornis TaxID=6130 RepID=A0AAD9V5Q9_ACRCE|nr:hypothetical protein P5673_015098 [Acropora cervicornis]
MLEAMWKSVTNQIQDIHGEKEAINEHSKGKQHRSAVHAEMAQRVSVFHSIGLLKKVSPTRNSSHC